MRGTYKVVGGHVRVTARSSLHDTRTVWSRVEGTLEVDPDAPEAEPRAEIRVDMRELDTGDRLKNWKLKSDLAPDRYPTATFTLRRLENVRRENGGGFRADAVGLLAWRGRDTEVRLSGRGRLDASAVEAEGRFELDVRHLGVEPPKILMFRVEPVVEVEVQARALKG